MTQESSQSDVNQPTSLSGEPAAPGEVAAAATVIVARAGRTYRRYRYIMATLMVCFAVWFLYDGFKRWPEDNERYDKVAAEIDRLNEHRDVNRTLIADLDERLKQMKHHPGFDVALQKVLGFGLFPVAAALLVFWLRRSAGEYRLENGVLHLPGHPAIPLDTISTLDKTKWDRKGIAFAEYHLPGGETGRFRLDDFIYDAHPIRDMVKQIEASILARAAALGVRPMPPSA